MWRRRMQDLARGTGRPHAPLFAPVLFGIAAQIEAIEAEAMARDATRIRKNVGELRRALGTDAVFCAVPRGAEARALGHARGEFDAAALTRDERIAASLDAARQWQADPGEPVILAALTGPATLLAQLRAAGAEVDDEGGFDFAGRALAALARLYAEAGVHVLQFHEAALPGADAIGLWKGALGTIGNVARFHRIPPILVVDHPGAVDWPAQVVAAPTPDQQAGAMARPHGRTWSAQPPDWPLLPGEGVPERYVTTVAEVPATLAIATLLAETRRVQGR